MVSAYDPGLLRGDGVYEVVRVYAGVPFALGEHLERLRRSADGLRIPLESDAVLTDVRRTIERAGPRDFHLRIVLTRGGARLVLVEEVAPTRPLRLGVAHHRPSPLLADVKSLSYAANALAARLAVEAGFDDVLLVTPEGVVLEASSAAVFWVEDGTLFTPPLDEGILDSITRRHVRALCGGHEARADLRRIASASEVFLAGTRVAIAPVIEIEDVGRFEPGEVTRSVAAALRAEIARGASTLS